MILLSFFPEIVLAILLFVALLFVCFRLTSQGVLPLLVSAGALVAAAYYLDRADLAFFTTDLAILKVDSFSRFGRIFSLSSLSLFSLGIFFQRTLSVSEKQNAALLLVFQSLFLCGVVFANALPLLLGCAYGVYFCSMKIVLVESRSDQKWVRIFREKSTFWVFWLILGFLATLLSSHLFHSLYFDEWMGAAASEAGLIALSFLLALVGVIPLLSSRVVGRAPVGLGVLSLGTLIVLASFWFRAGVPFFSSTQIIPKPLSQALISLLLGGLTLRSVFGAVRTRDHHSWLSMVFSAWTGVGLFVVLLPAEHALPSYAIVTLSLLFTIPLVSHAFQEESGSNKGLMLFSLIALLGLPPMVLGDELFRMIRDLIQAGNPTAGVILSLSWLGLALAATQIIAKTLRLRVPLHQRRPFSWQEGFFLTMYVLGIVLLTAFRESLVNLLNEHPPQNLW